MASALFYYQLVLVALVWLCLILQWAWPSDTAVCPTTPEPPPPRPKRTREPTPFAGRTYKPPCDACEHTTDSGPQAPSPPPPRIVMTRGRRREIDTSHHFCPNPACAYRGSVGWGNLRANGHPDRGRWRHLLGIVCHGAFLETLGPSFHGKRVAPELIVRVIACLAEGLGIRGTARGGVRSPRTPGCHGSSKQPTSGGPWRATFSTPSTARRSNSMRWTSCSGASRQAQSVRTKPSRASRAPRSGCGRPWTPRARCC